MTQQDAKEAALQEICAAQNVPFPGPRQRRILDAVFPIIWKARGEADRAAVSSALTRRKVKTFDAIDVSAAIAALDENGERNEH